MAIYITKPWYGGGGGGSVPIVSFSDGTDAEISAMLAAYYNDEITWGDMGWSVGDTRKIHLNSYLAPSPYGSTTIPAQEVTIVIVDNDHTTLSTPVNGHTNACITVQFREALGANATSGKIYIDGNSSGDFTFTKWSELYMRTYMNSELLNAFSYSTDKGSGVSFKELIKISKHYRHTTYNGTESEEVNDTLFLPSYPEIFGTAASELYVATSPTEGTQFEYFKNRTKVKYINNNGSAGGTAYWWSGSPVSSFHSSVGYKWLEVASNGTASYAYGDVCNSLAPAFAM